MANDFYGLSPFSAFWRPAAGREPRRRVPAGTPFTTKGTTVQLSLGMTQAEVEDKLTPAEGSSPSTDTDTVIYGDTPEDRIAVTYYDGVVNNISLMKPSRQRRPPTGLCQGGITVGSSKEDLDKVYGACTMSNEQDQYFVYYYDSSHTLLTEDQYRRCGYMSHSS